MPPHKIKILTYNIYHGEAFYRPGTPNLQEVAKVIDACQPDLVALQEVDRFTQRSAQLSGGTPQDLCAELAKLTGLHGVFGKAMDQHGGDYGEAILSRLPLDLALSPPTTRILPTPEGGESRALLTIDYPLGRGEKITFAATHLCHQHEANRLAQVKGIIQVADALDGPFILAGDFNFETGEAPYHVLAAAMKDTGVTAGNTALTWPYDAPTTRLDIVFVDKKHNWAVKDVALIDNDASDHFPVLVTLELHPQ
ncbi:hypothetical protein AXK12_04685 [Cephaloticoccus capnophilus]|uniref:Endonuclease/exonuclease/phosphatase domain-containing protein n=1 Tax=Cephaloticoccus capnophilus TaxID=1548208 RepID=A0A139SM68_9BACT|nr:endonuclease/exonuclease/phosphatase family protein [Cephaloticoccus capnophilus]KXU35668.1 hypothetical protein AXK12_04685 [Cephaloticoccus capnophilus]